MNNTQDIAWMIGRRDPGAERHRSHLIALREAQMAADFRAGVAEATRTGPTRRLALAGAGTGSNADLAACCA